MTTTSSLFGSLSSDLADYCQARLQHHWESALQDLPLMTEDKKQAIGKALQEAYGPNLDVWELYGERNVFTLDMYAPHQQEQIRERYEEAVKDPSVLDRAFAATAQDVPMTTTKERPPSGPPPSSSQVDALQHQLNDLRDQLQELQKRQARCQLQAQQAAQAQALVQQAQSTLLSSSPSPTIPSTHVLLDWQRQVQEVVEQLEAGHPVRKAAAPVLTLEQRYLKENRNLNGQAVAAWAQQLNGKQQQQL